MNKIIYSILITTFLFISDVGYAENVYVKYKGVVPLDTFNCAYINRSSLVNRLCYDQDENYLIVLLNSTYYHYCEIPAAVVTNWLNADSMGRFYLQRIKGNYDCRLSLPPNY